MANGLLGYQQQSQLAQAIQSQRQRDDEAFMGNLLRDQIEGAGNVSMVGGKPVYEPGLMDFMSKDAALNAFIQYRKGRVSDAEILAFNEQFKQMKGMRESKELDNLNRLSAMGLSDTKLRKFVSNNPALYGSVVDRILALEGMGDEGMASAALLRSKFLPQKTVVDAMQERFRDAPLASAFTSLAAVGGATALGSYAAPWFVKQFGQNKEALKVLDDLKDGSKYVKKDGVWYHTKVDRHKITKGKNKGKIKKTVMKGQVGRPVTLPKVKAYLDAADQATTPSSRQALANIGKTLRNNAAFSSIGAVLAPTIGRGIGGLGGMEEGGETVGQLAGGGLLGAQAWKRGGGLLAGMIARRAGAGAANFNPWVQAGLLALDLGIAAPMLWEGGKSLLGLSNKPSSTPRSYRPSYSYQ